MPPPLIDTYDGEPTSVALRPLPLESVHVEPVDGEQSPEETQLSESEEDETKRLINQKRIAFQMRRGIERYARKEKATRSGYQTNDESFYDVTTIAQLLPYVIASVVNDTAIEQAQNLVNDGTPRKPSAPAEGGNLLATLIDIKKSYELLDEDEQKILRLRYHENYTLQQLSEVLECAISTADRRCGNALRKLLNFMGGESPYV